MNAIVFSLIIPYKRTRKEGLVNFRMEICLATSFLIVFTLQCYAVALFFESDCRVTVCSDHVASHKGRPGQFVSCVPCYDSYGVASPLSHDADTKEE
jgi:hypothetical protein